MDAKLTKNDDLNSKIYNSFYAKFALIEYEQNGKMTYGRAYIIDLTADDAFANISDEDLAYANSTLAGFDEPIIMNEQENPAAGRQRDFSVRLCRDFRRTGYLH